MNSRPHDKTKSFARFFCLLSERFCSPLPLDCLLLQAGTTSTRTAAMFGTTPGTSGTTVVTCDGICGIPTSMLATSGTTAVTWFAIGATGGKTGAI